MAKGWIRIHKSIFDCPALEERGCPPWDYRSAFIYLLARANFIDTKVPFDGQVLDVKRGSFVTSVRHLQTQFHWGIGKVYRFIRHLEAEHMVEHIAERRYSIIKIVNYDRYQSAQDEAEHEAERETDRRRNDGGTMAEPDKNIKNIKNKKKNTITRRELVWPTSLNTPDSRREFDIFKSHARGSGAPMSFEYQQSVLDEWAPRGAEKFVEALVFSRRKGWKRVYEPSAPSTQVGIYDFSQGKKPPMISGQKVTNLDRAKALLVKTIQEENNHDQDGDTEDTNDSRRYLPEF